jgi:hypothetical protein
MLLAVQFSLKLLAHKVVVDTLVLDAIKETLLPYQSSYVPPFWAEIVHMTLSMMSQSFRCSCTSGASMVLHSLVKCGSAELTMVQESELKWFS